MIYYMPSLYEALAKDFAKIGEGAFKLEELSRDKDDRKIAFFLKTKEKQLTRLTEDIKSLRQDLRDNFMNGSAA